MTTHRRYTFHDEAPRQEGHEKVQSVLQHACETNWWFNEPEVFGKDDGRLTFSVTVSARDQWFVHVRAMQLAGTVYRALGLGPRHIPEPLWEPLAPHTNRFGNRQPG